jgi:hypothetical protein
VDDCKLFLAARERGVSYRNCRQAGQSSSAELQARTHWLSWPVILNRALRHDRATSLGATEGRRLGRAGVRTEPPSGL